jgi:hypothetical protein
MENDRLRFVREQFAKEVHDPAPPDWQTVSSLTRLTGRKRSEVEAALKKLGYHSHLFLNKKKMIHPFFEPETLSELKKYFSQDPPAPTPISQGAWSPDKAIFTLQQAARMDNERRRSGQPVVDEVERFLSAYALGSTLSYTTLREAGLNAHDISLWIKLGVVSKLGHALSFTQTAQILFEHIEQVTAEVQRRKEIFNNPKTLDY